MPQKAPQAVLVLVRMKHCAPKQQSLNQWYWKLLSWHCMECMHEESLTIYHVTVYITYIWCLLWEGYHKAYCCISAVSVFKFATWHFLSIKATRIFKGVLPSQKRDQCGSKAKQRPRLRPNVNQNININVHVHPNSAWSNT